MNNFAALLSCHAAFIARINILIINGRNIQHIPCHFQIRAHAGIQRRIVIAGMAGNFAQFICRHFTGFNQALLIRNQATGIVIF